MIVSISLVTIGADANNFNLYTNTGSGLAWVLLATGVTRAELLAPSSYEVTIPDSTTQVKVESTGVCDNYIVLDVIPYTTTSTSTTSTTSTSSTSTTTTTTTLATTQYCYIGAYNCGDPVHEISGHEPFTGSVTYYDQFGVEHTSYYCLEVGVISVYSSSAPIPFGMTSQTCPTTTTTTTTVI